MSIGRGRTSLYHYGELDFRLRRAWDGQIVQQRHLRCNLSLQPGRGLCTGWQVARGSSLACLCLFGAHFARPLCLLCRISIELTDWAIRAIESSSETRLEATERVFFIE